MFPSNPTGSAIDSSPTATVHEVHSPEDTPAGVKPLEGTGEGDTQVEEFPSKMAQATEIFRRMSRKKGTTRREIIEVFVEKVGLTKAGASTYYQMIKKNRRSS
jgi:hypothetical protein